MLTLAQVEEILNVRMPTIYALPASQDIRGVQLGERPLWRVRESDLADYLERAGARLGANEGPHCRRPTRRRGIRKRLHTFIAWYGWPSRDVTVIPASGAPCRVGLCRPQLKEAGPVADSTGPAVLDASVIRPVIAPLGSDGVS